MNSKYKKVNINKSIISNIVSNRLTEINSLENNSNKSIKDIVKERIKKVKNGEIPSTYTKSFYKYYKKYQADRLKSDDKFRLDRNISRSIRSALKNSKFNRENHWKSILGYTIKELKERLVSTIPEGYVWQDYLDSTLELDHLTPVRAFNYTNINHIDFKKGWGLNNLRLLSKKENRIKSGNLKKQFQPALKLVLNNQVISQ